MIDIKVDGIDDVMKSLDSRKVTRAARLAINEGARAGRTTASKAIRSHYNIKTAKVNKELRNVKLATLSDLTAILSAKGRPISLTYFGAKWTRGRRVTTGTSSRVTKRASRSGGGVTVRILRGRTTRLPHAFIATTKAGKSDTHTGVFERSGRSRLPIQSKATITIASMFSKENVLSKTIKSILDRIDKRFKHHLDRF